jgi:hypothetical protein
MSSVIANTPTQWGPMIWNIIHTATLKIGGGPRMEMNIIRLFLEFTKILPHALPCQKCQMHSREFISANRGAMKWGKLNGDDLRAAIAHFFWDFHNNANKVKDSPTNFYEFEKLIPTYSSEDALNKVRGDLPILLKTISAASMHGIIKSESSRRFKQLLQRLASLAINGY